MDPHAPNPPRRHGHPRLARRRRLARLGPQRVGRQSATNFHTNPAVGHPGACRASRSRSWRRGSRLEVENRTGQEIVVLGYKDEPYLRIGPEGVFQNKLSPATYINRSRQGGTRRESAEKAKVGDTDWEKVSSEPLARWHDHRIHWMGHINPPEVRNEPGRAARHQMSQRPAVGRAACGSAPRRSSAKGDLVWEPGPSPLPWYGAHPRLAGPGRRHRPAGRLGGRAWRRSPPCCWPSTSSTSSASAWPTPATSATGWPSRSPRAPTSRWLGRRDPGHRVAAARPIGRAVAGHPGRPPDRASSAGSATQRPVPLRGAVRVRRRPGPAGGGRSPSGSASAWRPRPRLRLAGVGGSVRTGPRRARRAGGGPDRPLSGPAGAIRKNRS